MNIAVYCASDFGNQDVYKGAATELGKWIGKNNLSRRARSRM